MESFKAYYSQNDKNPKINIGYWKQQDTKKGTYIQKAIKCTAYLLNETLWARRGWKDIA